MPAVRTRSVRARMIVAMTVVAIAVLVRPGRGAIVVRAPMASVGNGSRVLRAPALRETALLETVRRGSRAKIVVRVQTVNAGNGNHVVIARLVMVRPAMAPREAIALRSRNGMAAQAVASVANRVTIAAVASIGTVARAVTAAVAMTVRRHVRVANPRVTGVRGPLEHLKLTASRNLRGQMAAQVFLCAAASLHPTTRLIHAKGSRSFACAIL